jgi:hypothetical protein
MSTLLRLCLLSASFGLLACGATRAPENDVPDSGVPCIAVVQYARPAGGGDCQRFSTPCDVPEGYVVCCGGLGYGDCLGQSQCVDDPTDACNPAQGGRDCTGICQP